MWFSIRVYPSADGVSLVFRDITLLRTLAARHEDLLVRLLEVESLQEALSELVMIATNRRRALLFTLEPTHTSVPISESIRVFAAQIFDGTSIDWWTTWTRARSSPGRAQPGAAHHQGGAFQRQCARRGDGGHRHPEWRRAGPEIVVSENGVAVDPESFGSAPGHRGLATSRSSG